MIDLIFHNGQILTMNDDNRIVQAVAVTGNRIAAVGGNDEILALANEQTELVDLKGKTVIPGIVDSHNHIIEAGHMMAGVLLFGAQTIGEMQARVAAKAAAVPKDEWIEGAGWIESQFAEYRLPTRWDLDHVAPDHPVILHRLFAMSVANSRALQLAGIDRSTPDPERGQIDRDPSTGEPTGVLRNGAQNLVRKIMPRRQVAEAVALDEEAVKRATHEYVKYGITTIIDPGVTPLGMRAYQNVRRQGELPVRVSMMPAWHGLYITQGKDLDGLVPNTGFTSGFGDERLNVGALKMAIDGGLGSKTAMLNKPYKDGHVSSIPLRLDIGKLEDYFREGHHAGWSIGIHCCGDLAQDIALRTFDKVMGELDQPHVRHNIIHGYLPTEESLEIMARRGIAVSVQPGFIYVEGDIYFDQVEEERLHHYKPLKTYLERGILVAANSDMTSAHYNPFLGMYSVVARKTSQGRSLGTAECLDRMTMLRLFTINGAYLAFLEDKVGSLEVGKLADLAVLSDDILTVPDEQIKDLRVEMTVIDGEVVHDLSISP